MPVTTTHPDYDQNVTDWLKVRRAIRGRKKELTRYLRQIQPFNAERQKAYEEGAVYTNFSGRTSQVLQGAVFRKPAEVELPANIQYLEDEADSDGNSLEQFARSVVNNVKNVGRHGILVDYPQAPDGLSREEVAAMRLRPILSEYKAEDIINWRTNGGKLVLVVLRESEEVETTEFDIEVEDRYRVLMLIDGYYVQRYYDDGGVMLWEAEPRDASGARWEFIPFVCAGSVNNDINVDEIPFLPLADLNIAAFRNSADYEEGVFIHGQPTLHINTGDTSATQFAEANGTIVVGSREGIMTQNGGVDLVQAQANSAAYEALQDKFAQAVQLGARLVEQGASNQTATAVLAESAAEHSVLESVVSNCSDAIRMALEWAARFAGGEGEVVYELNRDFFDVQPDAQMISALMGLTAVDLGYSEVLRRYLIKTGVMTEDDDLPELGDVANDRGMM